MENKSWYRSKTLWANSIALAVAMLMAVSNIVPPEAMPYMGCFIAILNIWLRFLTDQPIGPTGGSLAGGSCA